MWLRLDEREHATVLAALRMWQKEAVGVMDELPWDDIATNGYTLEALDKPEIDTLCERINIGTKATPEQIESVRMLRSQDDDADVDDDAATSRSDENGGTWIAGWLWLADSETCSKCGCVEGSPEWGTVGDGFDGMCPSCADKEEELTPDEEED